MKDEENYNIVIDKIASKLKKLRIEKGFTSYENFAYQNDLPRVQYWRMEKGTNFTIKNLLKILDIHKREGSDTVHIADFTLSAVSVKTSATSALVQK